MKKLLVISLALLVMSAVAFAGQWQFKEATIIGWDIATDGGADAVNVPGLKNPYGVTVDPDGNIWCSAYYQRYYFDTDGETKIWPDDITIEKPDTTIVLGTYPLFVYKPDGTFDRLQFLTYPDGSVDTLDNGSRGMVTAPDGNIIYANNNMVLYKINYQTYEVMNKYEFDFSPARPAVDDDGFIYLTGLFGGKVVILDPDDFSVYNEIPDVQTGVSRTLSVSADGQHVYAPAAGMGVHHYYSPDGVDGSYTLVDTLFKQHNGVSIAANFTQWDPAGLLWVGTVEEAALKLLWSLDPADNYSFVDTTSFVWWANTEKTDTTTGGYPQPNYIRAPRDAAFSADGMTMHIADFYSYTIKTFEFIGTDVKENTPAYMPQTSELGQNYPNPFNPTTTIPFAIDKAGTVELKVFDTLGREVRTLINNKLGAGNYKVAFDAAGLASGVYYYRLKSDGKIQTKQMILMK